MIIWIVIIIIFTFSACIIPFLIYLLNKDYNYMSIDMDIKIIFFINYN